ncbi:MAG: HPr family phosphocarrier protein [Spirochaetales bacterium]|nr:HPr family phosphocarrier protein [Spirochaetales bacterium]
MKDPLIFDNNCNQIPEQKFEGMYEIFYHTHFPHKNTGSQGNNLIYWAMISRKATIMNQNGIHVRPSKIIAASVADYPGKISVSKDGYTVNSISAMNLLTMALIEHDQIVITVTGKKEELVAKNLAELFESHFDFSPR